VITPEVSPMRSRSSSIPPTNCFLALAERGEYGSEPILHRHEHSFDNEKVGTLDNNLDGNRIQD